MCMASTLLLHNLDINNLLRQQPLVMAAHRLQTMGIHLRVGCLRPAVEETEAQEEQEARADLRHHMDLVPRHRDLVVHHRGLGAHYRGLDPRMRPTCGPRTLT